MNAEALIGRVLGTCALQQIIGHGGMGAVFLAQQSRPRRQVAVKVLLPAQRLTSQQLASFLERFRRETDAAASLAHPNILPVHEYGEQDGLAYLVMPYVSGGTLRDYLERHKSLPFPKVINYLEQLVAAIDAAHERGVIHRDIKPANILMTPEERLLLTDFGLVKVIAEGQAPRVQLTGVGMPMGTPDYMAPEQALGGAEVDTRADLYSLGVILYQMVTGTMPFQGETPMQIVAQHLQSPPRPPRLARPDLPIAAEQVLLRILAKRPADRYGKAQDLLSAFSVALVASGVQLGNVGGIGMLSNGPLSIQSFAPRSRGLFDPAWQSNAGNTAPSFSPPQSAGQAGATELPIARNIYQSSSQPSAGTPGASVEPAKFGLLRSVRKTGMLPVEPMPDTAGWESQASFSAPSPIKNIVTPPPVESEMSTSWGALKQTRPDAIQQIPFPASPPPVAVPQSFHPPSPSPLPKSTGLLSAAYKTGMLPASSPMDGAITPVPAVIPLASFAPSGPLPPRNTTGALMAAYTSNTNNEGASTTIKLTEPMKMVQVPIAGQPGRYLTGLLPVLPTSREAENAPTSPNSTSTKAGVSSPSTSKKHQKKLVLALAALLIVLSSLGTFWFAHTHTSQGPLAQQSTPINVTPNLMATAQAQATVTALANIILVDPLDQNIHNWLTASSGSEIYAFKDGAYHITNNNNNGQSVSSILPDQTYGNALVYTLTMEETRGDETASNNAFGMIFRYNSVSQKGKLITTCYAFEITDTAGGQYQFWKFDNAGGSATGWTQIWYQTFGKEFHRGYGSKAINTIRIVMNGSKFTFIVNEKRVVTLQDRSFSNGGIGMLVNLKGTEVAFSHLLLTYH